MIFTSLFYSFAVVLITLFTNNSGSKKLDVISTFNLIETTPEIITFTNEFEINNTDGHLQGIQRFENEQGKYIFMSGSSDSYSYCSIVKSGDESKVVSLNKLMEKPFKHVGGIQIFQNYLAVGIEDNSLKDKSKVCIYNISKPEKPFAKPIAIIERGGDPLRSTAGCVGMTNYKNKMLIVVDDWDSKNIDFYSSDFKEMADSGFKIISSIDTENISRAGWINKEWHSYQNINLFNIDKKLYLIGLGQNRKAENIADLFEVSEETPDNFSFKKVAAKIFICNDGCNFKAGAGVEYANGKFEIFSCGYNISNISFLNVFSSK